MTLFYKQRYIILIFLYLLFCTKQNSIASEPANDQSSNQPTGTINAGIRVGENVSEFGVDVTLPIWQSPIATLFFAPGFTWYENDYQEKVVNLGVGVRRLFDELDVIIGGNMYYDSLKSVDGNQYDQFGAGVELLSTWVDASLNYYLPENTVNKTGDYTEVSQDVRTTAYWSELYGQGNQILQDRKYKKVTATTTRLFEFFEEPMEGFDLETALKVPGLPDWFETRLVLGWYNYSGSNDFEIEGYKVGWEVRPARGFAIEAVYYEDVQLHGDNLLVEARASIPFSIEQLFAGENPFAGTSEFFKSSEKEFNSRLLDQVRRDAIIPIQDTGPIENLAAKSVEREVERWNKTHVILTDIVFVDGGNSAEGQNGTFENPYAQVQLGVNAAFGEKNVYVNAFSGQYYETITLSEGVRLLGSGTLIEGYDYKTFGSGIKPIINGLGKGPVIRVTKNNVIDGFHLINTTPVFGAEVTEVLPNGSISPDLRQMGVFGNGVSGNIQILNNTIEAGGYAIDLAATGTSISVMGNDLFQPSAASSGNMFRIESYGNGRVEANVFDNVISTNYNVSPSWAVMFYAYENSAMDVSFTNNQVNSAGSALVFNTYNNATIVGTVVNNTLSTKQWSGMRLGSYDNGSTQVTFIRNKVNAVRDGIYFWPSATKPILLDGYGNTIKYGSGFEAVESTWPASQVVNNLIHP